jgi:hypothetical protein
MYHEISGGSMKQKRKRAAGGGRKPNDPSGPGVPFSVRIPEDVLNQLRAGAKRRGGNGKVSEELVGLLRFAFAKKAEEGSRSDALQALFVLIEELDRRVVHFFPDGWRSSPYAFGVLRGGIISFLDALRPPGKVVAPPDYQDYGEADGEPREMTFSWPTDPESVGREHARVTLMVARWFERGALRPEPGDSPEQFHSYYSKIRAIRELGLTRGNT